LKELLLSAPRILGCFTFWLVPTLYIVLVLVNKLSCGVSDITGRHEGRPWKWVWKETEKKKVGPSPIFLRAVGVNPRMEEDFLVLMVKAQLHTPPQCQ